MAFGERFRFGWRKQQTTSEEMLAAQEELEKEKALIFGQIVSGEYDEEVALKVEEVMEQFSIRVALMGGGNLVEELLGELKIESDKLLVAGLVKREAEKRILELERVGLGKELDELELMYQMAAFVFEGVGWVEGIEDGLVDMGD